MALLNLHKGGAPDCIQLRRGEGVVERPRELPFGAVHDLRLRRRRLQHGAQRVPEAVVAPPVADAAQHGVPVQRPRAGVQVQEARHRRRRGGVNAAAFTVAVPGSRRRVLGRHHGRRHGGRGKARQAAPLTSIDFSIESSRPLCVRESREQAKMVECET
jgi:hypothetical protein